MNTFLLNGWFCDSSGLSMRSIVRERKSFRLEMSIESLFHLSVSRAVSLEKLYELALQIYGYIFKVDFF